MKLNIVCFADNQPGTTVSTSPVFAMSGDDKQDVNIPVVFLFNKEGQQLLTAMRTHAHLEVFIGANIKSLGKLLQNLIFLWYQSCFLVVHCSV